MFELPDTADRKPSESVFQIGNYLKKYCAELDCYIFYRAGYWARWFAIVNGFVTFLVIFLFHQYGYFTALILPLGAQTYYEIFIALIDYAGFFGIFIVLYHVLWFHKAIGFGQIDILRTLDQGQPDVTKSLRRQFFFASIIIFFASIFAIIFPSVTVSIFHEAGIYGYKARPGGLSEVYANNLGFVFALSVITIFSYSLIVQGFTMCVVFLASIKRRVDDHTD